MAGFNIDDYLDVSGRIDLFYEKYPDGRLCMGSPPTVQEIGGKWFVWYHARAHRFPEDPLPGDGWAAEPVPGPTPYTKDSELMNAETAAWGRAIVALGFGTKKIASKQEVLARTTPTEVVEKDAPMSPSKRKEVEAFAAKAGFDFYEVAQPMFPDVTTPDGYTNAEARQVCEEIARRKKAK